MARREVQDRQFSLYFPSVADKERWRKLAKPYTLNHWIILMVQKAIENKPTESSSDEVNALRKRNLELEQENKLLVRKLGQSRAREVKGLKGPMPLDKQVVNLLKSGGFWPSTKIIRELKITVDGEDDGLYLESSSIHGQRIEPLLKHSISEVDSSERVRAVSNTLEQLSDLELVENTWQGWRWRK